MGQLFQTASSLPQLLRSVWLIAGHQDDQGLIDVGVYQNIGSRLERIHPEQRPRAMPGLAMHPEISGPPAAKMPSGHMPGPASGCSSPAQMSPIIAQAKALQFSHSIKGSAEDRSHISGPRKSLLLVADTHHSISDHIYPSPNLQQEEGKSYSVLQSSVSEARAQRTAEGAETRKAQLTAEQSEAETCSRLATEEAQPAAEESEAQSQPRLTAEEAQAEEAWRERQRERERQRKVRTAARLKANVPSEELFILFEMMVTVDKDNVDDALLQHIALAIKVSQICIQQDCIGQAWIYPQPQFQAASV